MFRMPCRMFRMRVAASGGDSPTYGKMVPDPPRSAGRTFLLTLYNGSSGTFLPVKEG